MIELCIMSPKAGSCATTVIPAKGDLCTTTVIPAKAGIQGWWGGGPPSYESIHLLIHLNPRHEEEQGYANLSESGYPEVTGQYAQLS